MFNYSKLKGRVREVYGTQARFANSIGMSKTSVSAKLNNQSDWTQKEIVSACGSLHLSIKDIPHYFFAV